MPFLYRGVYYHCGRFPLDDSFYNLWSDLAIEDEPFEVSDGLGIYMSAKWPDYFYFFWRAEFDYLLSKNLSLGIFAYPELYKKTISFSNETDNWTGTGSGGLEDHWELRRKLRLASYNFGPDVKFKIPLNRGELSLTYLFGWSYLLRSAYEFSYFNQLTGTGEKGFLGLLFAQDGNLTKIRYKGHTDFHRIEFGFTRPREKGSSFSVRLGYQFLKMNNISYSALKFGDEDFLEASSFFYIGQYNEYQVGEGGDIFLDDERYLKFMIEIF